MLCYLTLRLGLVCRSCSSAHSVALGLPSDGPSRFRPCLRLVLMSLYIYTHRVHVEGTSLVLKRVKGAPHKFTPMPGVHILLQGTAHKSAPPLSSPFDSANEEIIMPDLTEKLFENGNKYRLHQDLLRWTLLAGYAAFLVGVMSLNRKPNGVAAAALVAIGICYMFILAVENFFYNLYAKYAKDCETMMAGGNVPRTLKEFTAAEHKNIGPFHHSFFFAILIVLLGNALVASGVTNVVLRRVLYIADGGFSC
jgi:hypothetical protein